MPPKKAAATSKTASKKLTNTNKSSSKKPAKKWNKGKTRDSLNNAIMWDKTLVEKLNNEVPKYKVITPSVLSDRLKITVSLAHAGLKYLSDKKVIRLVAAGSNFTVYTRAIVAEKKE